MQKKGFTLIELLVVSSIIGLLSSIVLTTVNAARAKARDARRIADLRQIQTALELFYDAGGKYPTTGGSVTWNGHWFNFKNCLHYGTDCSGNSTGSIANYQAPMSNVPNDPLNKNPDNPSANEPTYYFSWEGCSDQMYILRVPLETDNAILKSSAKGDYYRAGDGGCNGQNYCIKQNWCH